MSVRRVLLAAVLLGLPLAYFVFFVKDALPERSSLEIDWARVRALAGPVGTGPRAVRSEVVARGRFFGWMVCAGCGWGDVPMEFRTYQLEYADGSSVVVDAVHDADRHASMPLMADYDADAFAHQTKALRRADRILLTHEHWDHASGLLAVIDDADVRPHLLIPTAQRHSTAMREAGLSEERFVGLPEAPDVALRPVAPGVVSIAMPGHTPGSQVVYVRRADGAEYLFLGDVTWNARNLRERRGKSLLIGLVAGEDRARIAEQIAYFSDLATSGSAPGASFAFVVAHDPVQNAALVEQGLLESGLVSSGAYSVVPDWPALEPGVAIGETSGVGVDGHGHVFLFHRGPGPSILGLDPSDGRIVVRFGEGVFENPHGLAIGPNDEIWVTDTLRHQVLRFSHDGELLSTIGERGVPGDDLAHFDQPTDLAFASTGDIFVSDGYGNSRVVRLSKEGKPITTWGRKGRGPGEFDLPHGIALDARDRIYVADRGNERVQVFDRDGHFITAWGPEIFGRGTRAWGVEVAGDRLFVIDGGHMNPEIAGFARLTRMDLDGRVEAQWSRYGAAPGELAWGHDLAVGADGSVYTAEVRINDRIQKFVPEKSDAP